MTPTSEHPSFLELDRLALGAQVNLGTTAHVALCEACRQHVAAMQPLVTAAPSWVTASSSRKRRSLQWLWMPSLAAAALAIALVVVVTRQDEPFGEPAGIQSKGMPTITVFVKRGERVFAWDGHELFDPHDRIELEVVPEGFALIQVWSDLDAPEPSLLFQTRFERPGAQVLPRAWDVDDSPDPERLLVLFANEPAVSADVKRLLAEPDSTRWHRLLTFDKANR